MSSGLCNAPATFQRIILHIFDKMSVGNFKAFLDDNPRANRQAEATNKILVGVIYKSCAVEGEDWEEKLPSALWAYCTSYKVTTGHTLFQLMYG